MREVSIQTMQRYLRRYRGKGVFLSRWHVDMKCYIVNENLADHAKPAIETPEARIACVSEIRRWNWINSDGHVYRGFANLRLKLYKPVGLFRNRVHRIWLKILYRIVVLWERIKN